MLLSIPFPFPIPFDVLAMPMPAIQQVGSHKTESATIADARRLSRKGCHTTAIIQSVTVADDRRFDPKIAGPTGLLDETIFIRFIGISMRVTLCNTFWHFGLICD